MSQSDPAAAPSRRVLLRARGVDLHRAGGTVLSGVDVAVHAGEVVTVIGPNGAGKTTLLKTVLGLIEPDRGNIERYYVGVGYMPQRLRLDPILPLTVKRFLEIAGRGRNGRIADRLAEVGAGHVIDRALQDISGGELQRVMLARALLGEPELLVLDEPAQGVDVAGQAELFALIRSVRDRRGLGVLMTSHDLHLVMAAADWVICLNGHVCCAGKPEAVSRDPTYVDLLGGALAQNIAVYRHHHDHHHGVGGEVVADGPAKHDPHHRHG